MCLKTADVGSEDVWGIMLTWRGRSLVHVHTARALFFTSKPAGMGEERIWVWYTSRLSDLNGGTRAVGSTTPWSPPNLQYEDGSTVTQCILERKMGPYIVKPCSLNKWNFRYTHSNIHALSRMSIQPHEYAINGAPQPYRSQW